jgi:hypothetical protein
VIRPTSILALLVRDQLKMFYAAKGSPSDPMRNNIELGTLEPLVWGATTRALLAHLSVQEIAAAIARREPSPAHHLEPDEAELHLRQSLARILRDGYDITHAHRTLNTLGIAVPFFDGEGEVVGSVAVLIPEFRWASASQDAVVGALVDAAARMSGQLGYAGPGDRSWRGMTGANWRERRAPERHAVRFSSLSRHLAFRQVADFVVKADTKSDRSRTARAGAATC